MTPSPTKLDEVIAVLHDIVRLQSRFVLPPQDVRLQPPAPGTQSAPRNNNGHGNNGHGNTSLFGPPRGPPRNTGTPPPDPNGEPDPPTPRPPVPPVPTETKPQAYKLPGKAPKFSGNDPLENVRIWLQQMNDLFSAGNIPPSARMGLTTPYLRDNASSSYWALFYVYNHSHLLWERFQEEMIRLFDNTNARNENLI